MPGVFDGMAGVLNAVFGAPVTYLPVNGQSVAVQSVFREEPITVSGSDGGDVLIEAPTWKVPSDVLSDVPRGARITLADGRIYRILNRIGTGSPAADAFVVYELELVS